jgi:hypothetical protein
MALLLSGKTKNSSAPGGYIGLGQTQQQLGNTPSTGTGFTVVTINSVTSYRSSVGFVEFTYTNTASIFGTTISDGSNVLKSNGTGSNYILGPTFIPDLQANTAFKGPVKTATTANIVLVGGTPLVVSNHILAREDRVLVRAQDNPAENGIYIVSYLGVGNNGTWIRSTDTDTAAEMAGALVSVSSGTAFTGKYFFTDFLSGQTLDVDPVNWYQIIGDNLTEQELKYKLIDASPIGTRIPDVGYFTDLYSTGTFQANKLKLTSTETSTSTTTGALVVAGGIGLGGDINAGGNVTAGGFATFSSNTNISGITQVLNATSATSTFSAALLVSGGVGVNGALYARSVFVDGVPLENAYWNGGEISSPFYVANIEGAFNTYTGALKVLGGVGIGGDVYIGKSLTLESPNVVDSVYFRMRNTATNGQSYTWNVGGNNAAGQGGTSIREGSLTLYDDRNSTYRLAVVKTTGNLLVGQQADNLVDKLQVNGSIQFGEAQLFTRTTSINNTATTVIDSWPALTYRTTKSLVQITDGTGPTAKFHVVELVILRDNAGNVYKSEYGIITTGGQKGIFDVDYNDGGNGLVRILFKADTPSAKTIKIQRTSLAV